MKFLLKFRWYRRWQAKRSRKRLAKESIFSGVESDEVESYTPVAVREEEEMRWQKKLTTREESK